MRSPLEGSQWHIFEDVASTQDLAAVEVLAGSGGVFFAANQTGGRGRFGRDWVSSAGESLTMSLAFPAYADHDRPYLIGMTVAVAAAAVLHCELAWPNDLIADCRKLGGVLTELVPDNRHRRVPVVGVGINLNQKTFPAKIKDRAISAALYNGGRYDSLQIAQSIVERLAKMPEPDRWSDLAPVWNLFDYTPGKKYRTNAGQVATALGIGPEGQLMCSIEGETTSILAADAIFGNSTP